MNIEIKIQELEDNFLMFSSGLRIRNGKMSYYLHAFGEAAMDGDETEIAYDYDQENTRKFLESLGLEDKSAEEVEKTLREKFSQRPSEGVFNRAAADNFQNYADELGLKYSFDFYT